MINIISSSSKGNAVIYGKQILVDCGVPFALIQPFLADLRLVLLTHEHGDHFNFTTIKRLAFEKPTLRFACGEFLKDKMKGIKNLDIVKPDLDKYNIYDYGQFIIVPVVLYHDVPNFGYRIIFDNQTIFHATDTAHLNGISAKGYDYYCLEHNYDEETINQTIQAKESRGEFAHERGAINSHLSYQQAQSFYFENKKETSQIIRLHETK